MSLLFSPITNVDAESRKPITNVETETKPFVELNVTSITEFVTNKIVLVWVNRTGGGARIKGVRKYDAVTRSVTKPFSSFKIDGYTSIQCNIIPVVNVERI